MPTQHNTQAAHPLNGVRAVAFDCYGTLLRLTNRSSPHRLLLDRLNLSAQQRAQAARLIMTQRIHFHAVPALFGCSLPSDEINALIAQLKLDTATTEHYEEVPEVIATLKWHGLKLALVSNSAAEYGVAPRLLLNDPFDVELWSFEIGAMKPDPSVYSLLCDHLSLQPHQILMIGDRLEEDVLGPRRAGLKALLLDRTAIHSSAGALKDLRELINYEQPRVPQ